MADKGFIIVEGATAYCSSSVANNSKGTAVPMEVKSQKKKLGKNKYFAQSKPVATYLDDKAESFGAGNGFGNCKGSDGKPYPCKAKCSLKYKDYYENVEFNKSMKILLDVSTATCPGYGVPGTVAFATTGQSNNVSQIDVKEADEFSVANTSPQWQTAGTSSTATSVNSISMTLPQSVAKPTGTYYYLQLPKNPLTSFLNPFSPDNLTLNAQFKGDATKIIWAIFKGEDTKDKVKTFMGLGSVFNQSLSKTFDSLPEGKYRIEAYGKKAGDKNCAIIIEVVKDFVKKIVTPGTSTLINIPIPISVEYKLSTSADQMKILNGTSFLPFAQIAHWRIKQGTAVLYNSHSGTASPHLVGVARAGGQTILSFKNAGKYTVEAFTDPNDPKPETVEIKIENTLGVMGVSGEPGLLRSGDMLKIQASKFNVAYLPAAGKTVHWYLKKEGSGRITAFESSPSFKTAIINKRADALLSQDAQLSTGEYIGKYTVEAYANPLGAGKQPAFTGSDTFHFEVIQNVIDKFTLPAGNIPKGTKVKYTATARIATLAGNEAIKIEVPQNVTDNGDGTLTFNELGEFTLSAYLTGDNTDNKKIETKIKVSQPTIKRALWAYGTGVKRTETGFGEDTYGFVEIDGLQNQTLKVKVWVKGDGDDFYKQKEKFMLEEKSVTLNSEGKASFLINTTEDYKKKLDAAIPKTAENPTPKYRLVFTIELQASTSTDVVLPASISIEGTKPVVIDATTTYLEVLDSNEELVITSEQKIVSVMFSTENGKDIQRQQTFYGKTHKIWVHTVNMTEEVLKIDVFKEVPKEGLNEKDHIIYTHESKETYKEEKTGKDGLVEVSFTAKEEWKNPPKNFDYYIAQVSRQLKDPADPNKKIWKAEKLQVTINDSLPANLVRTEDMEKLGIRAKKQDGTPFTQEEMLELRKQFIFYEAGCLKVSQKETPEAIDNDVKPVVVEMAEVRKQKTCYCNRGFTEKEMEDLIKTMTGGTEIWKGIKEKCDITDKTIKSLTAEVNAMFAGNGINRCMQKISFLANVSEETGFFVQSKEELSGNLSSQSKYKGRGILQITGVDDGTGFYNLPGPYSKYGEERNGDEKKFVGDSADLISSNLHYAVDVGGWIFNYKKVPSWVPDPRKKYSAEVLEVFKWKREYFSKGLGKSLNDLGLLMEEEEEKYFFLQGKILNGYSPAHKLERPPNGWPGRKKALEKLKTWFKYDKNVCNGDNTLLPNLADRAPWMEIALKIAKEMKGCEESKEPMYSKAKSYLLYCGNTFEPTDGENGPWCAAYMNWCIGQTLNPQTNAPYMHAKSASSLAPIDSVAGKKYKQITEPIFGCLVVYRHSTKWKGHTGFLYGMTKKGAYILLGGNQDQTVKFSSYDEYTSNSKKKKLWGFYIPADYTPTDKDKLTAADYYDDGNNSNYDDGDIINAKFGIGTGNNTGATN